MEYSVECKFVNVYLNDLNQGLYLFTETVKTSSNRVNIEDGYNIDETEIPFLLELDFKLEENLTTDNKILTLSTCSDDGTKRIVIHAVMVKAEYR